MIINNWFYTLNATFKEIFRVSFQEDVDDTIGRFVKVSERESHIGVSLLAARARSMGTLATPKFFGSLGEGLGFSDDVVHNYQGDVAEITATGSCIQLLCGASLLVQDQPQKFAKDKMLAALDNLQIIQIDTLIKVSFIV
jgi:hypothetical protein